jgi:tetratricopeptide (TPR) repeat protein
VISRYQRLHELGVANAAVTAALGTAYTQEGRWEEALAIFEGIGDRFLCGEAFKERWFNHALALYELGRDSEAFQVLDHSIHQMPDGYGKEQAKSLLVGVAIRPLGGFKSGEGTDWTQVVQTLLELRERGFESNFLKASLGSAQCWAGDVEAAVATFEAIDKRVDDAITRRRFVLMRAWAYCRVGRFEDVTRSITEAADEDWSAEERVELDRLIQLASRDESA